MGLKLLPHLLFNQICLRASFIFLVILIGSLPSSAQALRKDAILQERGAQSLVQQGRELYQAEQFAEAVTVWQRAAQAAQAQGKTLNQAMILSNLSLAYQQLGQWPQASQAIAQSLNLLQTGKNGRNASQALKVLAQALNTQGSLQLAHGQAEQALFTWQQAAATYAQAGDAAGITRSQINQAQALQALGLYRRTLTTLNQVKQTLQKQPNSALKAAGLRSLGNALRVVGDLDQARQVLQQSLAIARDLQLSQEIGTILLSLGNIAQAQPDTQSALAFYQQAAIASPDRTIKIKAQLEQLNLLLETKQWSAVEALWPQLQPQITNLPISRTAIYARINFAQSLSHLKQANLASSPAWPEIARLLVTAAQQAKVLGDQRATSDALGNLGGLYEQTQEWTLAQTLTQEALLLAQAIHAPDIAYRWQWQLGRLLKVQGDTPAAIAAYSEAVNTLESLRSDLVAINPDVQFSFRESVEPVYRQLVDLLLPSGATEISQANLNQARNVIESLQLAELENFFRSACLDTKPLLIDQVVDQNDSTAAVLYPIILPDRLEVILKLPRQRNLQHYVTHIDHKEVESTLEDLRQKLTKPYSLREVQSLSHQLYQWLLYPAEPELAQSKIKTLVFVLDGSLRSIPMAVLYNGQQYLVEKYGIALAPSLQLLEPQPVKRRQLKALTAGLTESRQGFSELPHVALELSQIKSELPTELLLNQAFTSQSIQTELNTSPVPIVHLATHGQFSSKADQTFILTWDGRINVNQLDTLLQSRDQSKTSAVELLVLSACQTAAGDRRAALGLAGVAVKAGARSTLASLWSLDDETSALFMSQFYQAFVKSKMTKAAALRHAQLILLQNLRYQHPRYWAPYVLVGNWL
jgi:CHAT domain-containing protein